VCEKPNILSYKLELMLIQLCILSLNQLSLCRPLCIILHYVRCLYAEYQFGSVIQTQQMKAHLPQVCSKR